MSQPFEMNWRQRLYRVVRRSWKQPLDASFSRLAGDRRWNDGSFEALYCCGSERVARGVAQDIFRLAGLTPADLQPGARPALAEISWSGTVADVCTADGVKAAGFPASYPAGVERADTRAAAAEWRAAGWEGVGCRSASLARMGEMEWTGAAWRWCEVALWPDNLKRRPRLIGVRRDEGWWLPPAPTED